MGNFESSTGSVLLHSHKEIVIPVVATQAQQETSTDLTAFVAAGVQKFHPSAAKGWIHFDGTGTPAIAASYNVSSLTDVGVGNYTVNFTTAFSSANYVGVGGSRTGGGAQAITTARMDANLVAAGAFGVYTVNPSTPGSLADSSDHQLIFFGDQ